MPTLPLIPLLELPVFRTGAERFHGVHVLLAAVVGGEWASLEQEVREGIACERAAAVGAIEISGKAVEQAAREFRMRRGLATADATHEWLAQWHLTQQEWMAHVRRTALRSACGDTAAQQVAQYGAPEHDVIRAFPALFASSPEIARVARTLASRAAALASMTRDVHDDATTAASIAAAIADAAEDAHAELTARLPALLPRVGFAALSDVERHAALSTLARIEAVWARFAVATTTPAALRDQLTAHRLDWVRVEYQLARFTSQAVACEAALCVRDDGIDLAVVAGEAGVGTRRVQHCLDAESPALRAPLLGAAVGDLLGPLADHGDYLLLQVTGKQLPSLDDPQIRARASDAALNQASTRAMNDHIRWEVSW